MEGFLAIITHIKLLLLVGNGLSFFCWSVMADFPRALLHSQVFFPASFLCWMVSCAFWKVFPHLLLSHGSSCVFSDVQWGGIPGKKISCTDYIQVFSLVSFMRLSKMGLLAEIILISMRFVGFLYINFLMLKEGWCLMLINFRVILLCAFPAGFGELTCHWYLAPPCCS